VTAVNIANAQIWNSRVADEIQVNRVVDKPVSPVEALALAVVLVVAFHAIPDWIIRIVAALGHRPQLSMKGWANLYDGLSGIMPLILAAATPRRSGLRIGNWSGCTAKVIGICALPVVLTAVIYPFTSQPFKGDRIGCWLISPAAQDLLFTGYLFGLFDRVFPRAAHPRIRIRSAILVTAAFFCLWHVPNFLGISAGYVAFQLVYTFIGGAWLLLARQLTGSLLPGLVTHMAVNLIGWLGW